MQYATDTIQRALQFHYGNDNLRKQQVTKQELSHLIDEYNQFISTIVDNPTVLDTTNDSSLLLPESTSKETITLALSKGVIPFKQVHPKCVNICKIQSENNYFTQCPISRSFAIELLKKFIANANAYHEHTVSTRVFLTNENFYCFIQTNGTADFLNHDLGQTVSTGVHSGEVSDGVVWKEKNEKLKYYKNYCRKLFYLVKENGIIFAF